MACCVILFGGQLYKFVKLNVHSETTQEPLRALAGKSAGCGGGGGGGGGVGNVYIRIKNMVGIRGRDQRHNHWFGGLWKNNKLVGVGGGGGGVTLHPTMTREIYYDLSLYTY